MLLVPRVLALALGAGYLGEAGFVLMVHDLVPGDCHLIASVASDGLVSADFAMLFSLADVIVTATVIRTVCERFFTGFLQVLFHVVKADLSLGAAIWAPKDGFVEDGSNDEVQVTLLT